MSHYNSSKNDSTNLFRKFKSFDGDVIIKNAFISKRNICSKFEVDYDYSIKGVLLENFDTLRNVSPKCV